jgi:hypothetical protein
MDADCTSTASFILDAPTRTLTVTYPTNGVITSADGFINCGVGNNSCIHGYDNGVSVVLSFTGNQCYTATSEGGNCSTNPCTLTMSENKTASGTFTYSCKTLVVTKPASGNITSADGYINCGVLESCGWAYASGATAILTFTPDNSCYKEVITGDCSVNPCTLTMSGDKTVAATFPLSCSTIKPGFGATMKPNVGATTVSGH